MLISLGKAIELVVETLIQPRITQGYGVARVDIADDQKRDPLNTLKKPDIQECGWQTKMLVECAFCFASFRVFSGHIFACESAISAPATP